MNPELIPVPLGLPLGGINRSTRLRVPLPRRLDEWYARDIQGLRADEDSHFHPWPGVRNFGGATYDIDPGTGGTQTARVTKIAAIRWGDRTSDIVRHSRGRTADGFNGFAELVGGVWTSRSPAISMGVTDDPYSSDMCPGGTNGNGLYVFSNGLVGPFRWDGTAGPAVLVHSGGSGTASPGRYVVNFADRCWIFNQTVGGTPNVRRAQWSLPGDSTQWAGTGSGNRVFFELASDITAVGILAEALFVYDAKGIVQGVEQFDMKFPVAWTRITTDGVGVWVPRSFLSWSNVHAFLSKEGFRSWDGRQITAIGAPIDDYILANLNQAALDSVCSIAFPDWNTAIWGLPMGTNQLPSEFWAYDFGRNSWHRVDTGNYFASPPTAMCVVDKSSAATWDTTDPAYAGRTWNDGTLAGKTWLDLAGVGSRPAIVTGHQNGTTNILDEDLISPTLVIVLESPDFVFDGLQFMDISGHPITVERNDMMVINELRIDYHSLGSESSKLWPLMSVDGGATYTAMGDNPDGSVTLAYVASGSAFVRVGSVIAGNNLRFLLTNKNPQTGDVVKWGADIEDLSMIVKRVGKVTDA